MSKNNNIKWNQTMHFRGFLVMETSGKLFISGISVTSTCMFLFMYLISPEKKTGIKHPKLYCMIHIPDFGNWILDSKCTINLSCNEYYRLVIREYLDSKIQECIRIDSKLPKCKGVFKRLYKLHFILSTEVNKANRFVIQTLPCYLAVQGVQIQWVYH